MHTPLQTRLQHLTRRTFLGDISRGVGSIALGSMLSNSVARAAGSSSDANKLPHFKPRAKRVLCLFQSEGFSHVDLFDQKPALYKFAGQELPASIKGTQRLTGMTSGQSG